MKPTALLSKVPTCLIKCTVVFPIKIILNVWCILSEPVTKLIRVASFKIWNLVVKFSKRL